METPAERLQRLREESTAAAARYHAASAEKVNWGRFCLLRLQVAECKYAEEQCRVEFNAGTASVESTRQLDDLKLDVERQREELKLAKQREEIEAKIRDAQQSLHVEQSKTSSNALLILESRMRVTNLEIKLERLKPVPDNENIKDLQSTLAELKKQVDSQCKQGITHATPVIHSHLFSCLAPPNIPYTSAASLGFYWRALLYGIVCILFVEGEDGMRTWFASVPLVLTFLGVLKIAFNPLYVAIADSTSSFRWSRLADAFAFTRAATVTTALAAASMPVLKWILLVAVVVLVILAALRADLASVAGLETRLAG